MFYYIEQVRSGNYERAVSAYHKIMRGRSETFYLLGVIEGTSRLRTLTAVALHRARVPDTAATALLDEYKLKIRHTTSLEESRHLTEKMIEQSCALVRSYWSGKYSQSISIAIDYIHRNIAFPLSVAEIAELVNLTPNSFSSKFHEEVGIPATAYISKLRLRTAAELLVYTNLSIGDICAHVGIMDSNYFSRSFKKEYKISPREYRKLGKAPEG
jgi:AraC-like DNA-binding protein